MGGSGLGRFGSLGGYFGEVSLGRVRVSCVLFSGVVVWPFHFLGFRGLPNRSIMRSGSLALALDRFGNPGKPGNTLT